MLPACFQLIPPPRQYFRLEQATEAMKLLEAGQMRGRGIIKFDWTSETIRVTTAVTSNSTILLFLPYAFTLSCKIVIHMLNMKMCIK